MSSAISHGVPSAERAREQAGSAKTMTDSAYLLIKADIIDCILRPGELLSTQRLMTHTGFGLSAVRAAMERLVAGDWVKSAPNKGYRIDDITLKDVMELYDLSELISPQLARMSSGKIAPIHDRLIELNAICFGPAPPSNEEEEQAVLAASGEILRSIRLASKNRYAISFTQQITERLDRVVAARRGYSEDPIDFRRDFSTLIAALLRNDADAAEEASRANVRQMRTIVVEHILRIESLSGSPIHTGK
ncbi:GntR family transcriptional regulator [Cucumibacter marinus]|uniref:GntR family transcriptional regulator n=1 Tax=Cucumibacter marinus TaxID=1121252 RepID=UPI000429C8B6|nr:GntR family transcriptional regulator [Cucumibacter marinus]